MCILYAQDFLAAFSDVREIGDVNEGVVERGEDACDAEDELACEVNMLVCDGLLISCAGWTTAYPRGLAGRGRCSAPLGAQSSSWEACWRCVWSGRVVIWIALST